MNEAEKSGPRKLSRWPYVASEATVRNWPMEIECV